MLPQLYLAFEILEIVCFDININFYTSMSVPFAEKCNFLENTKIPEVHHFKCPVLYVISPT
jgi:hypothetical protein